MLLTSNSIGLATKSWGSHFHPFTPQRKNTENCMITNAIPKSGTYFINRIVECLGHWQDTQVQINPAFYYRIPLCGEMKKVSCLSQDAVKKLRNGQFAAAHLPWNKALERVIEEPIKSSKIRHLFIYRDPRDVLVSYMRYVTYSPNYTRTPKARARQNFMQNNFSTDRERLTYMIEERICNTKARHDFLQYVPWLNHPHCCAISFEALNAEFLSHLNTNRGEFGVVLKRIFAYLEVNPSHVEPRHFYTDVYGKSLTATGKKN